MKRSINQKWVFIDWKFENQTSIDGRYSFMYSISQNPYFFKSLTNFEIAEDYDYIGNMFSSFIASNKSRSLIYRFIRVRLRELTFREELVKLKNLSKFNEFEKLEELAREEVLRLKELARRKILDYKYDDKSSILEIDIWENYYFKWNINKERDVDINHEFWKFILAKIWSSLYHYLILHRWYIPFKLKSKIKSMMKYMKNYKHSKNIKLKYAWFSHKLESKSLIDNLF